MINFEKYINKFVEIDFINNDDILDVGIIEKIDDEYILLKSISPNGLEDGYSLLKKNEILNITTDTEYLKNMAILMKENSKENILKSYIFNNTQISISNTNIKENVLFEILKKQLLCKIELNDKSFYGFIKKIENNKVFIKYFEEEALINIEDIKNMFIDAIEYRKDFFIDTYK